MLLTVSCNWVHQTCRVSFSHRDILALRTEYVTVRESENCEILTEVHFKRVLHSNGNLNALAKTVVTVRSIGLQILLSCILCNTIKRKKGKVVLVRAMKAYRGSRGTVPLILNFGSRW